MPYQLIENQRELNELCEQLSAAPLLAVDTEFVRTRTLYAKLGLLQVSDGNVVALIDPIAIADLSPFWQLMRNEKITKVLHAGSEDLEVFLTSGNCKPVNLIDSQIMMSFLGHGLSMGYAAMVKHFLDLELDKSESRTDWTKRPLTAKQLSYAGADVEHLFALYPKLLAALTQAGYVEIAQQETQSLIEKKFTPIDDSQLYLNMKMNWRLNTKQLNTLKFLCQWRYQQAKSRDLPLGFVVKDTTLMAVAQSNPDSLQAMQKIEGAEVLDVRHQGKAMLAVLKQAEHSDVNSYPEKIKRLDDYPGYKQIFKKVKTFITQQSELHHIPLECLASKKQINQFLTWHFNLNRAQELESTVELLSGWRKALVGEVLINFANNQFNV
ncbi:ribonuclease D [Colwellia asteriadis]|uniref:Ribonuclease D n=1 Tax=Colwellia asteriadis TaxID=517723 RepID=A0ABP3WL77_9GAMM